MYHLIIVVISIALMASLSAVAVIYSPVSAFERQRTMLSAANSLKNLESATIRYLDFNRDAEGYVEYAGDGTALLSTITPTFGFMPPAPKGFAWDIRANTYLGMPAVGVCLAHTGGQADYATIFKALRDRMGAQAVTQGNSCFASGYNAAGSAITYWVVLDHLAPLQGGVVNVPDDGSGDAGGEEGEPDPTP